MQYLKCNIWNAIFEMQYLKNDVSVTTVACSHFFYKFFEL
jgi:hypothetical protein